MCIRAGLPGRLFRDLPSGVSDKPIGCLKKGLGMTFDGLFAPLDPLCTPLDGLGTLPDELRASLDPLFVPLDQLWMPLDRVLALRVSHFRKMCVQKQDTACAQEVSAFRHFCSIAFTKSGGPRRGGARRARSTRLYKPPETRQRSRHNRQGKIEE